MAQNIQIQYYNGSSYEILYPSTLGSLISGAVASATTASSCSGNSATATKLASTFGIRTNLSSTATAYTDGSSSAYPGIYGTLPVSYGGTGVTSYSSLASQLSSYMSGAKIYTTIYRGTGTSTTLNFNPGFTSRLVLIVASDDAYAMNTGFWVHGASEVLSYWYSSGMAAMYWGTTLTVSSTTISITTPNSSSGFNYSNQWYRIACLG